MKVVLTPEEFNSLLTVVAQEELRRSPIKSRTGRLLNSVQVTASGTPDEPFYTISFEPYGLFLDEGVQGTLSGVSGQGAQGIQYKFSGRFKMIGGNLPYGARVNIHKFGLKPRPWVQNAADAVAQAGAIAFEEEIADESTLAIVESFKKNLPQSEIKLKL